MGKQLEHLRGDGERLGGSPDGHDSLEHRRGVVRAVESQFNPLREKKIAHRRRIETPVRTGRRSRRGWSSRDVSRSGGITLAALRAGLLGVVSLSLLPLHGLVKFSGG